MMLHSFDAYLFDLDGVVWRGTEPVPGVPAAINSLKQAGKKIRFLTNNASQHRARQCQKLRSLGVDAEEHEVITSGFAAAQTLYALYGPQRVFVLGTDELRQELVEAGHELAEERVEAVVAGLDREFSYAKLDKAFYHAYYERSRFVACNRDETYPDKDRLRPGAGASIAALVCCLGREPDFVAGKPHKPMFEAALQSLQLPAERCLMTGDKLDTDILGASALGIRTFYVLSGKGTREELEGSEVKPDFVGSSAEELLLRPSSPGFGQ